jgi:hypothetical protein
MFYHLHIHSDSLILFTFILAKPLIKFLILHYWKSLIILGYVYFMLLGELLIKQIFLHSYLGKFPSPFFVLSAVPQGFTLGHLLFKIFINDLSAKINYSIFLLFATELNIY